jgi:hypothetical protein
MNRRSFIKRLSALAFMPLVPTSKEEFKKEYPEVKNMHAPGVSTVTFKWDEDYPFCVFGEIPTEKKYGSI